MNSQEWEIWEEFLQQQRNELLGKLAYPKVSYTENGVVLSERVEYCRGMIACLDLIFRAKSELENIKKAEESLGDKSNG